MRNTLGPEVMVDREQLASSLQQLLEGRLSADEFEAQWREPMIGAPGFDRVWAYLEHYLSDGDIRARDERYRRMQDGAMVELIARIRSGAGADELAQITFLAWVRPD